MRLKTFLFPISLVISVAIFVGFIWPQIGDIMKLKGEMNSKSVELRAVQDKQAAIERVGNQLADNNGKEAVIKNYLPESKMEERIISSVNYLAGDANVALINVSIGGTRNVVAAPGPTASVGPAAPAASSVNPVQVIPVVISISGDYEKIRVFLDGLAHAPIMNTIKSLKISKKSIEKKEGEVSESNTLTVNMDVEFGYQAAAKSATGNLAAFNPGLDEDTISVLQKYVSNKSQPSGDDGGLKGKKNPFMPN